MTMFPTYVPLQKGKARVPKDLDESKRSLQTPLLPNDIIFEGVHLGWVPVLKFEDWDLIDCYTIIFHCPHFSPFAVSCVKSTCSYLCTDVRRLRKCSQSLQIDPHSLSFCLISSKTLIYVRFPCL